MTNIRMLLLAGALLATGHFSSARSIPEPETVFYGKILDRDVVHQRLLTEGTLQWVIRSADGSERTIEAALEKLGDQFSYRLHVPHQALSTGLDGSDSVLPLGVVANTHDHLTIKVNDAPAIIIAGTHAFDVEQIRRAATFRLDLAVNLPSPDSDGDGMPDWWEDANGLDKLAGDANGDLDGDGLSNFAEWRAGSDPTAANDIPRLVTTEVTVYPGGTTGVSISTLDSDTSPESLTYTLTNPPAVGKLSMQKVVPDSAAPDRLLSVGSQFTQADLDHGRLVFRSSAPAGSSNSFAVTVSDGTPDHEPATGTIALLEFKPGPLADGPDWPALAQNNEPLPDIHPDEEFQTRAYLLSRETAFTVWPAPRQPNGLDLSAPSSGLTPDEYAEGFTSQFGSDTRHLILGGPLADALTGGMEDDWIVGDKGDDILRGNGGADRFVYRQPADGNDTIEDFDPAAGDLLDLSRALDGTSPLLPDYVTLRQSGPDTVLEIDADGDGSGRDFSIRLVGTATRFDLNALHQEGHLLAGDLVMPTVVSLAVLDSEARENGSKPAVFELRRSGSLDEALNVTIQTAGSATNGIDYPFLGTSFTIPAGERTLTIPIAPYPDAHSEPAEQVQLIVHSGPGYDRDPAAQSASISIRDLVPEIAIETIEGLAEVAAGRPATLLITRTGLLDRSVLVRVEVGGTAAAGVDYLRLPSFFLLKSGESFALLDLVPSSAAQLPNGPESIRVSVVDDDNYLVTGRDARAFLVARIETLGQWQQTNFPDDSSTLDQFARREVGTTHRTALSTYAHAVNPSAPDLSRFPRVRLFDGHLAIEFFKNLAAEDLRYVVEESIDGQTWRAGSEFVEEITPPGAADTGAGLWRASMPLATGPQRFLRVRVEFAR